MNHAWMEQAACAGENTNLFFPDIPPAYTEYIGLQINTLEVPA